MSAALSLFTDSAPWMTRAVPHAYEEASQVQFGGMPGVRWVQDPLALNGSGYYLGPSDAIEIVVRTLADAKVIRIRDARAQVTAGLPAVTHSGLRQYQRDGVAWLIERLSTGGALLADEMGIGKSAQAIVSLDYFGNTLPVTIICPAVVTRHWEGQLRRWAIDPSRWSITSYGKLRSAAKKGLLPAAPWAVVIDEAHYVANKRALRSKAVAEWLDGQAVRPLVIELTGTPMTVNPSDLWHPLNLMHPGRWGTEFLFQRRYCGGHWHEITTDSGAPVMRANGEPLVVWRATESSRPDELATRLKGVMLRRTKNDVALELPTRTRVIHEIELPPSARRDAKRAAQLISWDSRARNGVGNVLSEIESFKIDAAAELAQDIVASGGRVLIGCLRRATAKTLGERLAAPVVTGEDAPSDRVARLEDAVIGVATIDSLTTGVDLIQFDNMILCGLPWVPSTILQFEARIHRIGQTRGVVIYYLVGLGTIDEIVRERVLERLEVFGALTGSGGDEGALMGDLGGGSEEEILAALAASITGKKKKK